jgi:hypothetical protein
MIEHNIKVFLRSRGISGSLRDSAGTARYVLVQEITHVLQGIKRHSDEGIVKAHWDAYDYYRMQSKDLDFTQTDLNLIRLGLAAPEAHAPPTCTIVACGGAMCEGERTNNRKPLALCWTVCAAANAMPLSAGTRPVRFRVVPIVGT